MTLVLQCPNCQARFKISANPVGKVARCAKCQNKWKVNATDVEQPPVAPAEPDELRLKPLDDETSAPLPAKTQSNSIDNFATNEFLSRETSAHESRHGETTSARSGQAESAHPHAALPNTGGTLHAADMFGQSQTSTTPSNPKKQRVYADAAALSANVPEKQRLETIHAAFGEGFRVPKAGFGYRFAATLAAFFMLLLPILYVAIIGLVIVAMGYHAVYSLSIFEYTRGRMIIFAVMLYAFPLLAGLLCVFFMFKPLFSRPARQMRERSLTRQGEPMLFALVDKVCKVVRAPRPKQINIDADVNASAAFRSGMWSLFIKGDLTLTIGAPLAAGFNVNQFVGVLAHEFGHFSQGGGMKMTYIVRSINHWFARVVFERDEWDQWLVDQVEDEESDFRIQLLFLLSQFFVFIARAVLWCLMMIGHIACSILLREMEYNADQFEIRLCGTKNFESTSRRMIELAVGNQKAQFDLIDQYIKGHRIEDLPTLTVSYADSLSRQESEQVRQIVETEKTGILDTHPSDKDRIAAARRANADAVFDLDAPARMLFQHYTAVTRNVTTDFYRMLR